MDLDDLGLHGFEIEGGAGGPVVHPAAAFAGVEIERPALGFHARGVVVAGDDDVGPTEVSGLDPVEVVVHDDRRAGELDAQRAVLEVGQDLLEAFALTVVVAVDAIERRLAQCIESSNSER